MAATEAPRLATSSTAGAPRLATCSTAGAPRQAAPRQAAPMQPMPGMPMPSVVSSDFVWPSDATAFERARDRTLWLFGHRYARRTFVSLALITCVLVVVTGLIIAYAVLGLYLGVDNGWNHFHPSCVTLAERYNHSLSPLYIPKPPGASWGWSRTVGTTRYCTLNQWWFNCCIKVFVILFSYINFLPIPWRLAIAHHAVCSRRGCRIGRDFYGRPTQSLWFNLPVGRRRTIALLLNLAWILHFVCLLMHQVYVSYVEGQTWPGAFAQNLPFVLSIGCAIAGGVLQGKAEAALMAAKPEIYPPRPASFLSSALARWWKQRRRDGEARGESLAGILRAEFAKMRAETARLKSARGFKWASSLTGIDRSSSYDERAASVPPPDAEAASAAPEEHGEEHPADAAARASRRASKSCPGRHGASGRSRHGGRV